MEALHLARQVTDLRFRGNMAEMESVRIDLHCQAKVNQRQVQKSNLRLVLVYLVSCLAKSQEIFKKCNTAVFMIFTSTGLQAFQGSGFFISPEGIAVSNYHVFEGTGMGLEVIKTSNDQQYKIDHVIFKDKTNDVMVFTVKAAGTKFNFIPVSSHNPLVGEKVYAIGSPRGLENTFSSGEISQFRENGRVIQISVPIDHGSSGGALINEYGEVIGITSGGFDDSGANLNFAVNINVVKSRL